MQEIRVIIADDNIGFCNLLENYLKQFEEIKIVGIAYTDEQEITLIEQEKPDIIITDLVRNHKYTGLDIIKDYSKRNQGYRFLVISADKREEIIDKDFEIGGYIEKPFFDYSIIIEELKRIYTSVITEQKQLVIQEQKKIIKFNIIEKIMNLFKPRK